MITSGQQTPDLCLPSGDGDEVFLKHLKGKWVVLFFYVRDNTSGCTSEALEFSELLPEFASYGAVVLGVSPDSVASHKKFQDKFNLSVKLLSDPEHQLLEAFGAWGKKKLYGKEYEGVIRSSVLLDGKGQVRFTWPKAKAKGHAQQVIDTLKELVKQEGKR
jgi:thioredoxin-dependent peroxiredoxin